MDLKPGQRLGPYRIDAVLGRGGMGVVYRALDERRGAPVALKTLLGLAPGEASDPTHAQRFLREARTAASVEHAHVVRVLFAGELGGLLVLVQELLPGGSLGDRLRGGPLPWREAVRLGAQVARGLAAIHDAGLVHRDLKPANVLLDAAGAAKISDFGLARRVARTSIALTKTGELVGTLEYLAPEQAGDGKDVGPPADLYALGGTLHALLTGRPPFEGQGYGLITKHLREPARPPSARAPDVPDALDRLVLHLLEKEPAARPTAADAARALDACLAPSAAQVAPPRGPLVAGGLAAVAALALVGGAGHALGGRGAVTSSPVVVVTEAATERPPPLTTDRPPVTPPRDLLAEAREQFPHTARLRLARVHGGRDLKSPNDVLTIAVTDDGRYVTGGGGLRVHELSTGRELGEARSSWIAACALLPGGRALTVGVELLVWDLASLTVLERLEPAPNRRIDHVSVSADGARALFGSDGRVVRVVDTSTWGLVGTFPGGTCAALSPDGRFAFVGGADGRVREHEVDAPTRWRDLSTEGGAISALGPSPDGRWLMAGSANGSLALLDLGTGRLVASQRLFTERVGSVAVAPDSRRAVVTCVDHVSAASAGVPRARVAWLVDLGPEGLTRGPALEGHTYMVSDAAFTPDGSRVLTTSYDHATRVFDATTGAPVLAPRGHVCWIINLALSPDGRTLATRGMDRTLRLWDLATGAERAVVVTPHETWSPVVAWSPDGAHLLTASGGRELVLWDVGAAGPPRERVRFEPAEPADGKIMCVAFVGARVLIGTEGGAGARVWEWRDGARTTTPLAVSGAAWSCAPWGPGQALVGTRDALLMRVDLSAERPGVVSLVSFGLMASELPDVGMTGLQTNLERRVAVGMLGGGRVGFWREGRTEPLLSSVAQLQWMRGVAVQPGPRAHLAASTSDDGLLHLWDLETGELVDTLTPRAAPREVPTGLCFSPDGDRLYVGTFSGVVLELEVR